MLLFLSVLGAYLAIGLVFGLWFVFSGVHRIDSVTRSAGIRFRLLILPGTAALWPVMLRKVLASAAKGESS